ncbi:DNA cross-link repair protein 1B [Capsaspora owczarzaki ATCC 30864]|uniref:5' exonuclease Apollo n=1 Tax=Capsaspora owczarzaki (strain ATCC 30864) TaxID=595528 RepID=A0A0D2X2I8_CAPO3|nr:DNA cross-link repair protein 1B [Capsaspora owczarzaki ATCC 30864]KJE92634.1 DNA cross-link repair protein 1B [Capsaspora owczarzaki ATCC 30864]|eukprot:XP_004363282.1 DNA cross-link repair protein 1B [Capsaspora owczarzaki ATCC 30864]
MVGVVIPNTPIALDCWRPPPAIKIFFLSHLHADHTQGLSPSWRQGTIYCSPVTRLLLLHKFGVDASLVETLELDEPTVVPLDPEGAETMTVTAFDANHCPGAVMFLLEGYFGNVLYTGDFRFCPALIHPEDSLLGARLAGGAHGGRRLNVDVLYLDNTYCDPKFAFPTREAGVDAVVDIIEQHPDHRVMIGIDTLGKEELLEAVALRLQTWIVVSQSRLNALQLIGARDVFTSNPTDSRIWVVGKREVTAERLFAWNREYPTIAILPSGQCQNPLYNGTGRLGAAGQNLDRGSGGAVQTPSAQLPVRASDANFEERMHWRVPGAAVDSTGGGSGAEAGAEHDSERRLRDYQRQEFVQSHLFTVAYSLHSSFAEMAAFVRAVKPRDILPIVPELYADLRQHFGGLLRRIDPAVGAQPRTVVPASVVAFMSSVCIGHRGRQQEILPGDRHPTSLLFDLPAQALAMAGLSSGVSAVQSGEENSSAVPAIPRIPGRRLHRRGFAPGRLFSDRPLPVSPRKTATLRSLEAPVISLLDDVVSQSLCGSVSPLKRRRVPAPRPASSADVIAVDASLEEVSSTVLRDRATDSNRDNGRDVTEVASKPKMRLDDPEAAQLHSILAGLASQNTNVFSRRAQADSSCLATARSSRTHKPLAASATSRPCHVHPYPVLARSTHCEDVVLEVDDDDNSNDSNDSNTTTHRPLSPLPDEPDESCELLDLLHLLQQQASVVELS